MRFRLNFRLKSRYQNLLPINYQHIVSAWIYRMLHYGNPDFSAWLHNQGYTLKSKKFKLFCFSELQFGRNGFRIQAGDRMQILSPKFDLVVSMAVPETEKHFVSGMFKEQLLEWGDRKSSVPLHLDGVELIDAPNFQNNTQRFSTLSPICVSKPEIRNNKFIPQYLVPEHNDFGRILLKNLQNKHVAFQETNFKSKISFPSSEKLAFRLLKTHKERLVHLPRKNQKPIKVKAYLVDFELTLPIDLMSFGYFSGLGEKNSGFGFGCVQMI